MQAIILLPKLAFHDRIALHNVNSGPKIRSGNPTGLKRLAITHPIVKPTTIGPFNRKGNGVSASLSLICIHEYPRDPKSMVRIEYADAMIAVRAIFELNFFK